MDTKMDIEKKMTIRTRLVILVKQFLKFGIVGVSNTIISVVIYNGLLFVDVHFIIAYSIAFMVSVVNAYVWNKKYVFSNNSEDNKSDNKSDDKGDDKSYGKSFYKRDDKGEDMCQEDGGIDTTQQPNECHTPVPVTPPTRKGALNSGKTFIKVFISYGSTFLLGMALLYIMVRYFYVSESLAQILLLFITIPANFLLNKLWAFNEKI